MKLGHIALYVKDIEESIGFYKKMLGAGEESRAEIDKPEGTLKLALLPLADCVLELMQPPVPPVFQDTEGLFPHVCFRVTDLDKTVAELKSKGVDTFETDAPKLVHAFGGLRNIFLRGPDGERIELLQSLS